VSASQAIDDALPALYARLRGRLDLVLYRHRIPLEDAEDLVQTALLLAVARWNEIREPERWLPGTLHNLCILYWRARKRQWERTRQLEELDLELGAEPDQNRRDCLADLRKVWHHLSPTQRTLLTLQFDEGLSPREAAGIAGLAWSSVRKITHRAFERLRAALSTAPTPEPARGQWRPRQPVAGQALAKRALAERLRAEGGAAAAWMAAVDAFSLLRAPHRRAQLVRQLAAVGLRLGPPQLAELGIEDLAAFRRALGGPATVREKTLYGPRSFLAWAGERGEHALEPNAVRQALCVAKTWRQAAAPDTGAAAVWLPTIEAFLAASSANAVTRLQYRSHLLAAGAVVMWRPLADLSGSDLVAYRAALLADGRSTGTHLCALAALRCFLVWAGEHGWHGVKGDVVRVALRGWSSRRKGHPEPGESRTGPASRRRAAQPPSIVGDISWETGVAEYLASFSSANHGAYRTHLLAAAAALGLPSLSQLTAEHLAVYRERLRADGSDQRVQLQALSVLRSFLVWAGTWGFHQLGAREVIAALPLPPIADEDFIPAFVAHFREGLAAGLATGGGRA
jgi:RNA polymerase sigma factor (sigma-70 family)